MSTDTRTIKYDFRPGITRETTEYAAEGGWYDGNRVRFRDGKPQNIRGWQKELSNSFIGTGRQITTWASLNGTRLASIGTEHKLYVYSGGLLYDVTPYVSAGGVSISGIELTNRFSTVLSGTTVAVSVTAHGRATGDFVTFTSSTTFGGNVTLSGDYQVSVVDDNTFNIQYVSVADATSASTGTATIRMRYPSGNSITTGGFGYGAGFYDGVDSAGTAARPWNVAATSTNLTVDLRQWTFTNFGEDLLVNPYPVGRIYKWIENDTTSKEAVIVTAAPTISNSVLVSPIDRHVFALGTNTQSGVFDPMLVRWSSQEDYDDWTVSVANTAGDSRLASGSEIRQGMPFGNQILVWTDKSLSSLTFVGGSEVFGTQQLGDNCGVISRNAAAELDGRAFWMGESNFFAYAGQVQILPCTVRSYVFDDFNYTQSSKVYAGTNTEFEEVTWLYCSSDSSECNRYVSYSPSQNYWTYGEAIWTTWADNNIYDTMFTTGASVASGLGNSTANNFFYQNEPASTYTGDAQPISSFIESAEFDMGDGDDIMYIDRIMPDFVLPTGNLNIEMKSKLHPNSVTVSKGPFTVDGTTDLIKTRIRGRSAKIRIATNNVNTNWKFGTIRFDMAPDGKR